MTLIRLENIQRAFDAQDPDLPGLVIALAKQPDPKPEKPVREGAPTFDKFIEEIRHPSFQSKSKEDQQHYRMEQTKILESPDAEVSLSDRLKLHEIIFSLWTDNRPYARSCLFEIIASVRLTYGPWRALKRIAKEAEKKDDTEILGALASRMDAAYAGASHHVSSDTLGYMCRRIWRYLQRTGQHLPVCYVDAVCDVLMHYTDRTNWSKTWIVNHIFYHESKKYKRTRFNDISTSISDTQKFRAFPELWQRTPRPLFTLLERAQSEHVKKFAAHVLKNDFRAALREVEPSWVARLAYAQSATADEFVVWILNHAPRFEQGAFREQGLHDAVLKLFDSTSQKARRYAAEYARIHARDLPVRELIRLMNNKDVTVRKTAWDLLQSRDPRKDVGLEAWSRLLETWHGNKQAATMLTKHFTAKDLTPQWFAARLLSEDTFSFAATRLPNVHPLKKLGPEFFCNLMDKLDDDIMTCEIQFGHLFSRYVLDILSKFDVNKLGQNFIRRLFIHPLGWKQVCTWFEQGKLKKETIGVDYLKILACSFNWDTAQTSDPFFASFKQSEMAWMRNVEFNEDLSDLVLSWFEDVRQFSSDDLEFDWLMDLVKKTDPKYHGFASRVLIKSFNPSDFVPTDFVGTTDSGATSEKIEDTSDQVITADFQGASFVFTGKLSTMTRKESQQKVTAANGKKASGVTAKLDYLVIGDEGSPFYGAGRKGSKQLKAESLVEKGAGIRIISETAFLQMLSGKTLEVSEDALVAGCTRLWNMLVSSGPADDPLRQFALTYLRMHHPDICLEETDRPVDPGAEIPLSFLTFAQVEPLFADNRRPLRDFGLELARWEFAGWMPSSDALLRLCELPHPEVRAFVAKSLLSDDTPEHRRYRLSQDMLTSDMVYDLCESADPETRNLGMELISRNKRLQLPDLLFPLTESPDNKVRGFVIHTLWSFYRERGVTPGWKPTARVQAAIGKKAAKKAVEVLEQQGQGVPDRPEKPPAGYLQLDNLFRRVLFEIPPGRPEKTDQTSGHDSSQSTDSISGQADEKTHKTRGFKLRHLPARKAKLSLIETIRDLAVKDGEFADVITPLLEEFMGSRGKSEQAACLVAVTRIRHAH